MILSSWLIWFRQCTHDIHYDNFQSATAVKTFVYSPTKWNNFVDTFGYIVTLRVSLKSQSRTILPSVMNEPMKEPRTNTAKTKFQCVGKILMVSWFPQMKNVNLDDAILTLLLGRALHASKRLYYLGVFRFLVWALITLLSMRRDYPNMAALVPDIVLTEWYQRFYSV